MQYEPHCLPKSSAYLCAASCHSHVWDRCSTAYTHTHLTLSTALQPCACLTCALASCELPSSSCLHCALQHPLTGECSSEVWALDSKTWEWSLMEVGGEHGLGCGQACGVLVA
jgi:hypothetical protein